MSLLILWSIESQAEHRVYQLRLTDTKTNKSREFLSTLMPEQYVFYYPITAFETLQIVDHWMCWQRSDGFKKLCTRPFSGAKTTPQSPKASSQTPVPGA
jgi:hypothetical protein